MHGSHDHGHVAVDAKNETRMGIAALITGAFMLIELAGGIVANSLALIADAGHMLTDFASLTLAWFAFRLARRPADWKRTYGFDRFQVLVAFTNGLALFVIAAWIVYEAIDRLIAGEAHVAGGIMVVIGVAGFALSLPLGILFALGRQSTMPIIKWISVVFIEFIRGVPLITLLFTASLLLNYFLPPGTNFDLILRVIIMVTLFATAYMAEVIRGGLAALPKGQYEAADALGLDYWKAQRLIIMPQALKISIPGIVNTFIGLFKDTTLVVFIGILDPIGRASAIRATSDWQGIYWELFIFIGAVFWIFCFSMSRYSMHLERRLKTDHR